MKRDVVGDDSTSRSSKRVKSAEGADTESEYGSMSDDGEADESAPTVKRDHARYLTPRNFWLDHIMKRQPLVIGGHPQEKAWKVSRKWTDNYMTNHEVQATLPLHACVQVSAACAGNHIVALHPGLSMHVWAFHGRALLR